MISGNYTYTTIATAATTDEQGIAAAHGLRLMGYTIRETAAAVATVNLCHGTANTTIICGENLAASTTVNRWFGPQGLPVEAGVWIERLTGGSTQVVLITTVST
jgi:hypothetical protein